MKVSSIISLPQTQSKFQLRNSESLYGIINKEMGVTLSIGPKKILKEIGRNATFISVG